jgi:hypothetical protein
MANTRCPDPSRADRSERVVLLKHTRAALVEHFAEGKLVHPAALLAPSAEDVRSWAGSYTITITGETWKPYERTVEQPANSVGRQAATAQMSAFE